jgi:hypothetical protein
LLLALVAIVSASLRQRNQGQSGRPHFKVGRKLGATLPRFVNGLYYAPADNLLV